MALGDQPVIDLLEELVAWTRFANRDTLIGALNEILADDKHLMAYDLSDGSRTQVDIASATGLAQSTISALWVKWRRLGIAREKNGRVSHLVRPGDIGLERAVKGGRQRGESASARAVPNHDATSNPPASP